MNIVLDTNVLLISIPKNSPYRPIYQGLLDGNFTLVITTEILNEYEEIMTKQINAEIAQNIIRLLMSLPNIQHQEVYYRWNLVENDPDDNKFVDCAIAGNAKYIVTEDKHFRNIRKEDLFDIEIISSDNFLELL